MNIFLIILIGLVCFFVVAYLLSKNKKFVAWANKTNVKLMKKQNDIMSKLLNKRR